MVSTNAQLRQEILSKAREKLADISSYELVA